MLGRIENILLWVAALSIALTTVVVVIDVSLAMAHKTTYVSAEIGPFFMAVIVFFAVPFVTRNNDHIRADFFDFLFPSGSWLAFKLVATDLLFVLYAGILLWAAGEMALNAFVVGERTQGMMRVPLWVPELGMVVGLLVLLARTLAILTRRLVWLRSRPSGNKSF